MPCPPLPLRGAGIQWSTKENQDKGRIIFPIKVPVGMLIAVSNNVAIDFGIPMEFLLSTGGYLRHEYSSRLYWS